MKNGNWFIFERCSTWMIDCSHFFRTALFTSFSIQHKKKKFFLFRRAFLMCRRGPINVKKPQTKWHCENANCNFFCLSIFFSASNLMLLLLFFFLVWMLLRFMFTIVCDIKLHKQWHTAVDMKKYKAYTPEKKGITTQKIVTKIDISNEKERRQLV